jgi:hypothetical protein
MTNRDLTLACTAAAAVFCALCWWTGLHPRSKAPPAKEDAALTALRDSIYMEMGRTATLARQLSEIRGPYQWRN